MLSDLNFKKYLDFRLLGLTGSIFLIISQFLPWLSGSSLLDYYIIYVMIAIESSFLYIFPLISGLICLIATILIMYKIEYRINSVIINFVGLGFFLAFLFRIIPEEVSFIPNAEIGFYFSILGAVLLFFDIIHILINKDK